MATASLFNQEAKDFANELNWSTANAAASAVTLRSKMAEKGWSPESIAASTGQSLAGVQDLLGIDRPRTIQDLSRAVENTFAMQIGNRPVLQHQAYYTPLAYTGSNLTGGSNAIGASGSVQQNGTIGDVAPGSPATLPGKYNQTIADYVNSLDWGSAESTSASAVKLRQEMAKQGYSVNDVSASSGHPVANVNALLGITTDSTDGPNSSSGSSGGSSSSYSQVGSSGSGGSSSGGSSGYTPSSQFSIGGIGSAASYISPEDVSNKTWSDWMTKEKPALETQAALATQRGNEGYDYLSGMARIENADLTRMREDVQRYGSQAYQEQNAGRYMADVQRQSDDQYAQLQRQAYASGIDPTKLLAQTANQRAYNTALGKVQAGSASRDQDATRYTSGLGAITTASAADRNSRAQMMTDANKLGTQGLTAGMELSKLSGTMGTGANQAFNNTLMTQNDAVKAGAAATGAAASMLNATNTGKHYENMDSTDLWYKQNTVGLDAAKFNNGVTTNNNGVDISNYDSLIQPYIDYSKGINSVLTTGNALQQTANTGIYNAALLVNSANASTDRTIGGIANYLSPFIKPILDAAGNEVVEWWKTPSNNSSSVPDSDFGQADENAPGAIFNIDDFNE